MNEKMTGEALKPQIRASLSTIATENEKLLEQLDATIGRIEGKLKMAFADIYIPEKGISHTVEDFTGYCEGQLNNLEYQINKLSALATTLEERI